MDFVFKIAGQAGAGVMTTGRVMVKCFTRGGYNALGYPEYPSLIRGGHNTLQVRVSDSPIHSPLQKTDLVLALNKDAIFYHMDSMASGGIMIYDELIDTSKFQKRPEVQMHPLPLAKLTQAAGGTEQMKNTAALGAALAAVDYPFAIIEGIMQDEFKRKGEAVVKQNVDAARSGYDYVKGKGIRASKTMKPLSDKRKMVITGNEAIALGAIRAGLKFYAAYPMTPASTILHSMIDNERRFGLVVKQTEDEIAAIHYAIGASFAGVRAMTGTSGGGFALMTEAMGLAGMTETGIVVAVAQRPGPSTCLPTWTEQGDLRCVLHASQGDFPRAVFAPGDVQECFFLTAKALNMAEKYQTPILILTDKNLAETAFSTEKFNQSKVKIERGKIAKDLPQLAPMTRWKRYALSEDGISERVFPGTPNGMHVTSSYEHDETGFSSESFAMRNAQVDKRARKLEAMAKEMEAAKVYGPKDAEVTLVGWGSMKMAGLDVLPMLEARGIKAKFVHFTQLFPLEPKIAKRPFRGSKVLIMIENNSTAQFAGLLKQHAGVEMDFHLLKYDGRSFFPEQIADEVVKLKEAGYQGAKEIRVVEKEDLEYYNPQRHGL
ncbi:MAG: 2-oxoacid:acceptor oxidoreductase subunit alpha [Candidatus ainarchaeum sp.]|nr:2-oxoacid:acceptor oxidoreductase subunit alpha [Candidatus ainarchaeum sp.]